MGGRPHGDAPKLQHDARLALLNHGNQQRALLPDVHEEVATPEIVQGPQHRLRVAWLRGRNHVLHGADLCVYVCVVLD